MPVVNKEQMALTVIYTHSLTWVAVGNLTGGALNPARVLGPALVYLYHLKSAWYYVIAELCGGALAAAAAYPLYGAGEFPMWDPVHDVSLPLPPPSVSLGSH
jgi:glycerol uptake facilitator-like aquaporin